MEEFMENLGQYVLASIAVVAIVAVVIFGFGREIIDGGVTVSVTCSETGLALYKTGHCHNIDDTRLVEDTTNPSILLTSDKGLTVQAEFHCDECGYSEKVVTSEATTVNFKCNCEGWWHPKEYAAVILRFQ